MCVHQVCMRGGGGGELRGLKRTPLLVDQWLFISRTHNKVLIVTITFDYIRVTIVCLFVHAHWESLCRQTLHLKFIGCQQRCIHLLCNILGSHESRISGPLTNHH